MTQETVEFKVSGQTVRGNLYSPAEEPKGIALLFLHGWTGRPNELAASSAAEKGYHAFTYAMRGHAPSEGDITRVSAADSLQDAIAAYDFLRSKAIGCKVVAVGNSYGGYLSALLGGDRELAALSLRVPANYPDDNFTEPLWGKGHEDPATSAWRLTAIDPGSNRALKTLHSLHGPVQILEAENDEIIPHQTIINYANAVSDPSQLEYAVMPGMPHSLGQDAQRNSYFRERLFDWLERKV